MKIKIDHIAKIEGHAGFTAKIVDGKFEDAKFETTEGARLIEGLLLGKNITDAPDITSRICGICPTVHNLTSIKALEDALDIKPSEPVALLRRIMMHGQIVHSHSVHLYFLSLPDFFGEKHAFLFAKNRPPEESKNAFRIREYFAKLLQVIGGRTLHPMNSTIGGFKAIPSQEKIKELIKEGKEILPIVKEVAKIFTTLEYPKFSRETNFMALSNEDHYPISEGTDMVFTKGENIPVSQFIQEAREIQRPKELAKRTEGIHMLGALSRLNHFHDRLRPEAKDLLNFSFPNYNSFLNIAAQAIEMVHSTAEAVELLEQYIQTPLTETAKDIKFKEGTGYAAIEAPRGTLFHHYKTTADGKIAECKIMAPTAQALNNLEEDCKEYLNQLDKELTEQQYKEYVRTLIRAYDPCISCSTH